MLTRQHLVERLRKILEENTVSYLDFSSATNIVFDFVVKLRELMLIKVLKDVEALKRDISQNFIQVAESLASSPLVIAEFDKRKKIPDNAVGFRYGVPFLNLNTFEKYIKGQRPFLEYTRGGPYIRIIIKNEESVKEALQKIGLSRRRIQEIVKAKEARITLSLFNNLRNLENLGIKELDPLELCSSRIKDFLVALNLSRAPHDSSVVKDKKVRLIAKVKQRSNIQEFLELSEFLNVEPLIVDDIKEIKEYLKKIV